MKKYLKNLLLCIKYPFLIPRNRFSGKIINGLSKNHLAWKLHSKAFYNPIIVACKFHKEPKIFKDWISTDNFSFYIELGDILRMTCLKTKEEKLINLRGYIDQRFNIDGLSVQDNYVNLHISKKEPDDITYGFRFHEVVFIKSKFFKALYNICVWINTNLINQLPVFTFTELDALETGWRKAFGEDICKEIKHSLLYTVIREEKISKKTPFKYFKAYLKGIKYLHRYRIDQIKEKWGYLHWYDSWSTTDINRIIDKYEGISYHTCINCGKPAKYISTGWISPYCEDCVDPTHNYKEIGEDKLI